MPHRLLLPRTRPDTTSGRVFAFRTSREVDVALVVIPARMGSTRLPGKALAPIGGVPMVEHVRRRACRSAAAERVVVATDDARILEAVRAHGGEAVLTGPAPSGTHRVAQVAADHPGPVINVQGDAPLLDPDHVDLVAALLAEGAEIATLSAGWPEGAGDDPALVAVLPGPDFVRGYRPGARLHVGIYGFAPGVLARAAAAPRSARAIARDLEQLAWLDAGLRIRVGEVACAPPSVDTPAQLERVRRLVEADLSRRTHALGSPRVPPDGGTG